MDTRLESVIGKWSFQAENWSNFRGLVVRNTATRSQANLGKLQRLGLDRKQFESGDEHHDRQKDASPADGQAVASEGRTDPATKNDCNC